MGPSRVLDTQQFTIMAEEAAKPAIHSTGRGGQGNIGPDTTQYTDGGIVREGVAGESADGEYSSGRGGAGNIGGATGGRASQEVVPPESEVKPQDDFHTGRGGGGNVHKEKYGGHTHDPNKPALSTRSRASSLARRRRRRSRPHLPPRLVQRPCAELHI